jgi:hypothetical protein
MNLQEERLVAELEILGVRYLSRQTTLTVNSPPSPARFLADLIRQSNSRLRLASIAVILSQPEFATAVPAALRRLQPQEQLLLKIQYTAAKLLQQKYAKQLQSFQASGWSKLPDLFSDELGLETISNPDEGLRMLGIIHRERTESAINWTGTYQNVACQLLRRWELERRWNQ